MSTPSRRDPGTFTLREADARMLALPCMLGHFLPWYTVRAEAYPWPRAAQGIAHRPVLEDYRHWRDPRSGYGRTHLHQPMLGLYDSRDPAVVAWQLDTAHAHGFGGFLINWYGQYSCENIITLHWLEGYAAWRRAHPEAAFAYAFSLDAQMGWPSEGKVTASLEEDLAYLRDHLLGDGYLLRDGRPVFSVFPYEEKIPVWRAALDRVFGRDGADLLWSNCAPGEGESGAYPWVRPGPATIQEGALYSWREPDDAGDQWLRDFYRTHGTRPQGYLMAGVWPGFDDQLVSWAWNQEPENPRVRPRVICRETTRGTTLALTWKAYLDYLRQWSAGAATHSCPIPLIQVVTWNDYAEASTVEPTRDYGHAPLRLCLDQLQEARRLWARAL